MVSDKGQVLMVPLASPLHDPASLKSVLGPYRRWLAGTVDAELPCASRPEDLRGPALADAASLLPLVVTGGTEQLLKAVAEAGRPVLVLAHDSMNSLPAALEALSSIPRPRRPRLVLGRGRSKLSEVRRFADASRTLARMGRHRIGLVGGPSHWLTYSLPNPARLRERLGMEVVDVPMQEFEEAYSSSPADLVPPTGAPSSGEATAGDLEKSARVYAATRALIARRGLTSVSPRCFDFIRDLGATACYALSRLNDEGVVAGCEGDVPATVGMITLAEVSGKPAFMANPSLIEGRRLVMAHCTIATTLTTRFKFRSHFESGIGVGVAGRLRRGARATVARYASDYRLLRAGAGTVVRGEPWSEKLCRTQVELRMDGTAERMLDEPVGNHLAMTYGDHVEALKDMASVAGIEFEEI